MLAPPPETADRRTAAEKRHDEKMSEREGEKTRKMAMKSHRERVNDFNAALELSPSTTTSHGCAAVSTPSRGTLWLLSLQPAVHAAVCPARSLLSLKFGVHAAVCLVRHAQVRADLTLYATRPLHMHANNFGHMRYAGRSRMSGRGCAALRFHAYSYTCGRTAALVAFVLSTSGDLGGAVKLSSCPAGLCASHP